MKRALVLALALPALVVLGVATPASANHMLDGRYHWDKPSSGGDVQIHVQTYYLQWSSPFMDALDEWGSRTVFSFSVKNVTSNCDIPTNYGNMRVCDANYGNTGWGALADVAVDQSTNHIQFGRVRFNTYYQWTYSSARWAFCQETGHVLGLDHRGTTGTSSDSPTSCMSYNPSEPEYPDQHDVDQLACQTTMPSQPEPQANCTEAGSGNSSTSPSCFLIICFGGSASASEAPPIHVSKVGSRLVILSMPLPPPLAGVARSAPTSVPVRRAARAQRAAPVRMPRGELW